MKFKFSKDLDYQLDAVRAVVGVFDTGKNFVNGGESGFMSQIASQVVSNELEIDAERILENVRATQKKNGIMLSEDKSDLESMDFSIEMETGTGKTYVYLRTALELAKTYGLKKFIVLVPSVAIREGVLKTIEQTREHFRDLYGLSFGSFAYDSAKLSRVREFAQSLDVQLMVMTIQSFNSDTKVLRQTDRDDTYGERSYLGLIAKTNPVVIMDEPQNMEGDLAKASIGDLNPLCKLRYSATHKELYNLLYRLTPIDAYRKGLVKKISVYAVKDNDVGSFLCRVVNIETKKGQSPKATAIVEIKTADGSYSLKEMNLKAGDDLHRKTNNDKYLGLNVDDVNAAKNRLELSDGTYCQLEAAVENKEAIFRTQIVQTIKAHLDKQEDLGERAKVLSLFFIDHVDNYVHEESLIRVIFEEEFERLKRNYPKFANVEAASVHKGYFSSNRKKGGIIEYIDTKGDSAKDKDAYDLIMKDKERLLSFAEPVSFIFSHSALKEGWDNPNVFQICTLREGISTMRKRQEIGRGMRLPLDVNGDRIYDQNVNVLTVIANESYQQYVATLQGEFAAAGYDESPETSDARARRITVKSNRNLSSEEFKALWDKISQKTKYYLDLDTDVLVAKAGKLLAERDISNLMVTVEKVDVYFDREGGIQTTYKGNAVGTRIDREVTVQNLVDRIARETGITRKTVFEVLLRADNWDLAMQNPEEYARTAVTLIRSSVNELVMSEGLRYVPSGDCWEVSLFGSFEALADKAIETRKAVQDYVVYDSKGEREFAQSLEGNLNVKVYAKLPRGFHVNTPLGNYIPDWAIVWKTEDGDKLYLVRETKFGYENLKAELPLDEQQKILCGRKHFAAIGVDFKVATKSNLEDFFNDGFEV